MTNFFGYSALLGAGLIGILNIFRPSSQSLPVLTWGAMFVVTSQWFGAARRRPSRRKRFPPSLRAAAAIGHPAGSSRWRRQRAKFLLRGQWRRRDTSAWLQRLSEPDAQPLWAARPRLGAKLQRPYLHRRWRTDARLDALSAHYDGLREFFSASARESIYRDGITVLRMAGPAQPPGLSWALDVKLVYRDQFEKEGELTLLLEDPFTGIVLAGLTFCICGAGGARHIWIGGLQSSPDPRTRELIQGATKRLHGMRPKALAVWLLQELCRGWGASRLLAISDATHIYRHWRKRRAIAARYDEFWAECGGAPIAGGSWELPLSTLPRRPQDLKPSRRKAHELRYAMLAQLEPVVSDRRRVLAGAAGPDGGHVRVLAPPKMSTRG